jgi:hypothetical protein
MSVLDGPRREIRRILDGGTPQWVSPSDDGTELVLMDGRRVPESTVTYLPPCDPTRSTADHAHLLPEADDGAEQPPRHPVPPGGLPLDELRG